MTKPKPFGILLAGGCAGAVTGLFGAGGGMVLVPMLTAFSGIDESEIFPTSVAIILPVAVVSLLLSPGGYPFKEALPYLLASALGGIACGIWGKKIPTLWLHRILGVMILWGGVRYLC